MVNSAGNVFLWNSIGWTELPGRGRDISVGADGSVWLLGWNNVGGGYPVFPHLTVADQFTLECLCAHADQSLTGVKVAEPREPVVRQRGAPRSMTVDNGSEFASRVMDAWAYRHGCNGLSSSGPRMCAWRGR